jgi:hypothetical protein
MRYVIVQSGLLVGQADDANGNRWWDEVNFCPPSALTQEQQTEFGVLPLVLSAPPAFNPLFQTCAEALPSLVAGVWTQQWAAPVTFVPQQVSGIQLRATVLASPQAAAIAAFVAAQSAGIQMAYATTDVFDRADVLLATIVTAGVLTSAQVDAIFIAAVQLIL